MLGPLLCWSKHRMVQSLWSRVGQFPKIKAQPYSPKKGHLHDLQFLLLLGAHPREATTLRGRVRPWASALPCGAAARRARPPRRAAPDGPDGTRRRQRLTSASSFRVDSFALSFRVVEKPSALSPNHLKVLFKQAFLGDFPQDDIWEEKIVLSLC